MSDGAVSQEGAVGPSVRQIARRLERIIALRTAFAPFRATVRARSEWLLEADEWRQLLTLWRPCQRTLDLLLEAPGSDAGETGSLRVLRQEIEGTLVDDVRHPAALVDLTGAFDQACEDLLARAVRELGEVAGYADEARD